ncbi:unnamed protein product [Dracunculus medinensis]|uniref:RRM domain-containing protein n=1 Tax=Dracunculus medinensis TaxID=318479 RepID=A0A0N4U0L4_DRAME|nr:unnamed protein product [Dracunculus medinensis]
MFDNPQQLKDLNVGLHRGFALITFENPKSALAALARRPHMIDNALLPVDLLIPRHTKQLLTEFNIDSLKEL